jgi:hypothetical protein
MSEVKRVTVGSVICWLLAVIFILFGVSKIATDMPRTIIYIVSGLILLPPVGHWLAEKTKYSLSHGLRFVVAIGIMLIGNSIVYGNLQSATVLDQPSKIGQSNTVPSAVVTPEAPTVFRVGDRVKMDTNVIVVNAISACKGSNEFLKPAQGKKFVVADITQENLGDQPVAYNVYNFGLQDNQDFSYTMTIGACQEPDFSSGTLAPGQKTRGYVIFELPKENTPAKLTFSPSWWNKQQIIIQL